ncbi:MAG: GntR family transcriptional regulator [Solobacterium sp.]|jgi:DNA-binding transcriptional regulator YhcF (GntR family)|nr:GntR family transcriptional regulator [Solobacterium sp.]MCH4223208.1 GntR family transcriptional regulator [Solobacterium sp.]MCH4266076.1 GntR family transcriptional regulator [Solobacterium sp.]
MQKQFDDNIPIYLQLIEKIKRLIVSGVLKPQDQMKSVREYALEYGVNPNTVQRALSELEREGYVKSERTSGRFISMNQEDIDRLKETMAQEETEKYLDQMSQLGFDQNESVKHVSSYQKGNVTNE